MTEQLSKDTAKMHRLELENQRLKSEIEDLKLNGIKEQTEKCLKLERENKCQKLTIKQLQVIFCLLLCYANIYRHNFLTICLFVRLNVK